METDLRFPDLAEATPSRVIVEQLSPELDSGRFPIKRTVGETVDVRVRIHADGHEILAGVLQYRSAADSAWSEVPLQPAGNDWWRGSFSVRQTGWYEYTVLAWIDRFDTWQREAAESVTRAVIDFMLRR